MTGSAHEHPAADSNLAKRLKKSGLRSILTGLLLAGLLASALLAWFGSTQHEKLVEDHQTRAAIIEAMALADLVAVAESPADIAGIVREWTGAAPEAKARVIRIAGSQLVASTFAADQAIGQTPRRLSRDEKPLYDQTQLLRSAAESNAQSGTVSAREIRVDLNRDRVEVAVPYEADGRIAGSVAYSRQVTAKSPGVGWGRLALFAFVPVLLMTLLGLTSIGRVPEGRIPWLLSAVAAVLFFVSVLWFTQDVTARVATQQGALSVELAADYQNVSQRYARMSGTASRNDWDVDSYRRPFGLVRPDGTVDETILARDTERVGAAFKKVRLGNLGFGFVLLGFFALGGARRVAAALSEHREAYFYVMPAMIGMLALVFLPFSYGILLGFTDQTLYNVNEPIGDIWTGIQNYLQILGDWRIADHSAGGWNVNYSNFYWTLFITVMWTVCNVTIGVSVGMVLALALNTPGLRGKSIYRVLLILPWAIPNYITALTWRGMFHPQLGQINQAIQMFGGKPVAWFDGVFSSFLTGIATNGWLSFPFMMVVVLGALQAVPQDMYEAATLDGANRRQRFWKVTLPLIKPALVPAVIISVVWTFNMFNIIYLVSGGQPAGANEILVTQAYKIAFEQYRYGYAAAYSVVIFALLLFYGVFQARVSKAYEGV